MPNHDLIQYAVHKTDRERFTVAFKNLTSNEATELLVMLATMQGVRAGSIMTPTEWSETTRLPEKINEPIGCPRCGQRLCRDGQDTDSCPFLH